MGVNGSLADWNFAILFAVVAVVVVVIVVIVVIVVDALLLTLGRRSSLST